jgi:mannose/fructose/N-acetylgalactosamine-specific phosphotransferase system component IIB
MCERNDEPRKIYNQTIERLRYGIEEGYTLTETCTHFNLNPDYFYDYIRRAGKRAKELKFITQKEYDVVVELYSKLKGKNKGKIKDNDICEGLDEKEDVTDSEIYGVAVRDKESHIINYEYCVKGRHGGYIYGSIDRDTMDTIMTLYTREGVGLTQRSVSRSVLDKLDVDFYTFQKILRVFEITKNSIPFGFHVLEENDTEEAFKHNWRTKEKMFFKKVNEDKFKMLEKNYLKILEENVGLKNKIKDVSSWIKEIDWSDITPVDKIAVSKEYEKRSIFIIVSDIHIGAMVNSAESLYENNYDRKEVQHRFEIIVNRIEKLGEIYERFEAINVINLGDALDGMNGQTARGGHILPQNMTNKEQFHTYIYIMKKFINDLYSMDISDRVNFYSVADANHDSDSGYFSNCLLSEYFKIKYAERNMQTFTFTKFIDGLSYGRHLLVFCHGKDGKDMNKGFPLILNAETENKIKSYLDYHFNPSYHEQNVLFIKGDLHQSARSYAQNNQFSYISVGSVFGSSAWSQVNFGNTRPMAEYFILDRNDRDGMVEGKMFLK